METNLYKPVDEVTKVVQILNDNGFYAEVGRGEGKEGGVTATMAHDQRGKYDSVTATMAFDQRDEFAVEYILAKTDEAADRIWEEWKDTDEYEGQFVVHKNLEYKIDRVDYEDAYAAFGKQITIQYQGRVGNILLHVLCHIADMERKVWAIINDLGFTPLACLDWGNTNDIPRTLLVPTYDRDDEAQQLMLKSFDMTMKPIRADKNEMWFGSTDHDLLFVAQIIAKDASVASDRFDALVEEYSDTLANEVSIEEKDGKKLALGWGEYDELNMSLFENTILVTIADEDIQEVQEEISIKYGHFPKDYFDPED